MAGFGIGVVAAIMGVAGGELLIPTIVLLYAVDIKTAGNGPEMVERVVAFTALGRLGRPADIAPWWRSWPSRTPAGSPTRTCA